MKRTFLLLLGTLAILVGVNFWLSSAFDMCGEETTALALSPSNEFGARTIVGSCGATTPNTTKVELFDPKAPDDPALVFQAVSLSAVELKWVMPDQLHISFEKDNAIEISKKISQWRDVSIIYHAE